MILSIQLVCMFKQRFATMMHVFASVNYNDTIEKIKHIKSENKKKRSKKDQRWSTAITREQTQTSGDTDFVVYEVSNANKKHKELPHVRINTVPTAQYSPEINQKRSSIA